MWGSIGVIAIWAMIALSIVSRPGRQVTDEQRPPTPSLTESEQARSLAEDVVKRTQKWDVVSSVMIPSQGDQRTYTVLVSQVPAGPGTHVTITVLNNVIVDYHFSGL